MSAQVSSRSLRNLVCIAIAIVGAAAFATGLTIWGLRADAIADAERDTGNLATIFAEQTNQSVKAFDGALIALTERLAAIHKTAPEKYAEAIQSEDLFRLLADVASRLPQADVIAVLSPDGHVVNHSRGWPGPNLDVSDREFFIAQRAANLGMHVGVP